eukprot:11184937-Lingulodinium_polyedra.AAC.1
MLVRLHSKHIADGEFTGHERHSLARGKAKRMLDNNGKLERNGGGGSGMGDPHSVTMDRGLPKMTSVQAVTEDLSFMEAKG